MSARVFARSAPAELKMAHRKVYATSHPDVFEVIASNGVDRYRIILLRIGAEIAKALCSCHAGLHENACWHAILVLRRKAHGSSHAARKSRAAA